MVKRAWVIAAALAAGCGARATVPLAGRAGDGGEIALYRDGAHVEQRIAVDVPASGVARAAVPRAEGVGPEQIFVVPSAGATVELSGVSRGPLEFVVRARPGRVALRFGYFTPRLAWEAAYTMIANAARDRATVGGALVIHNTTGIALRGARVRLVDAGRDAAARHVSGRIWGAKKLELPVRELGRLDLLDGDTRVELLPPVRRALRAVLVYEPIGAEHDHAGSAPVRDEALAAGPASSRVVESFEIARDAATPAGLPEGPVQMFDRTSASLCDAARPGQAGACDRTSASLCDAARPGQAGACERTSDGALELLGEGRLFAPATRVAAVDTIAIGTAADVTGRRERRAFSIDDERQRLVEEFVIEIENKRPHPVEVLLREHLYRSQNWTLAYISVPVTAATKEGPQQIAPRISVPARSTRSVMYVVVYTWEPNPPPVSTPR